MWLSSIKLAVNAGSHIYKKKKETQMRMADAQMLHAEKMAKGELEYSGKLLEDQLIQLVTEAQGTKKNYQLEVKELNVMQELEKEKLLQQQVKN